MTSYGSSEEVCDEISGPPCTKRGCRSASDDRLCVTESRRAGSRHRAGPYPSENSHAPRGNTRDALDHTRFRICSNDHSMQNQTCSVRVEVSSQFFNVTSGNIVRIHVKADGNPFPSTGFDVDGGINRPVATLTTAAHLKTGLSPGSHSVTVEFDMRSPGGTAEAGIRTVMIQVFTP